MSTLLFFDDQHLNLCNNINRKIGRPKRIDKYIFKDPNAVIAWSYPGVFFDKNSNKWRMTYQHCSTTFPRVPLLAESNDGFNWNTRSTLKECNIEERLRDNQLLPIKEFSEWSTAFVDQYAPEEERIKALVVYHINKHNLKSFLWTSPDGIRWSRAEGVEWQKIAPDPATNVFWNDVRKSYTFISRPDWTDRRLSVFETKDWKTYTEPELILQADSLDTPLANLYGMPVFPYEGYYVGLLWVYHPSAEVIGHSPHKFYGGKVDCQLAYSLDGRHFMRGLRTPFMPNGEPGEPDSGCVYPSSIRTLEDGSMVIYASASTHEHAYEGNTSILMYNLRKDGFVYLESAGGKGIVGTRPLYYEEGDVEINIQSSGGYARVQITDWSGNPLEGYTFDECISFSGDDTAWKPIWKSGRDIREFVGKAIRIEVELLNSRLYAIRGGLISLYAGKCWRLVHDGIIPTDRIGF